MCLPNFMEFCHCLFKILKNQKSRMDKQTDRQMDGQCENSIPPQFAGGHNDKMDICR